MLGMTLAHRLRQQGKDVTLFEAAETLGGLASTWQLGDIVWDRHYHVTLFSDLCLRALLAELELEKELDWVETKTGFFTDGTFYSMSNTWEFLRFPPLRLPDKLRLALTIFYASRIRNWGRLEGIPVAEWLRKWSGTRTFNKIWLPLLRSKLGESYKITSAAFIWATIARMYAARRSGLKKEMFGYVHGGYARILDRFESTLAEEGVAVRVRHSAKRVESIEGKGLGVTFENGREEIFDRVVLTVPAPVARRLCVELGRDETLRLEKSQYQGIICASLLLDRPLSKFYVTNLTDSWVPFTAVIEMSALVDRQHFGGKALVYLPKYVSPDDAAFSLSDEEIRETFFSALSRMYPQFSPSSVLSFRVSRVKHVFALSTLNRSGQLPSVVTSIPGVYLVNSAQIVNGTLNVNETVQLAERSARQILLASNQLPEASFSKVEHVQVFSSLT
jgi:protoporphyrinogen oxidase